MPSTLSPTSTAAYAVSALSFYATVTSAHAHDRSLLSRPQGTLRARDGLSAMTYQGCYSSSAGLTDQGPWTYQTSGYCQPICVKQSQAVLATSGGSDCWCGDSVPPANSKVSDSNCDSPCQGYDQENCGGINFWSVYLSGTEANVPNADGGASSAASSPAATAASSDAPAGATPPPPSSAAASTTAAPSVVTSVAPGQTVVITEPAQHAASSTAPAPQEQQKSHTNVGAIAAGVVIGVVAIAAIAGGLFFWLKRRRQRSAEDEYKRSNQVGSFIHGTRELKPPPSAWSNMSDSRLDPTAGRRNSVGSIADAEDYSRRILKVANPDNSQ